MLRSLAAALNETYDCILGRIRTSHQDLVRTALRWIAVAQQPLLVEELIEACTVKREAGGQVCEEPRLSPADIMLLLRHLVVLEKNGTATDLTPTAACNKDYIGFAHASVRDYLTTPECMAPALRQSFTIDLQQAHLHVANSCIAYLLRTNTLANRQENFPLRPYTWGFWALHFRLTVANENEDVPKSPLQHAQALHDKVAFGRSRDVSDLLKPFDLWPFLRRALLDCLRKPYFFEEYMDPVAGLEGSYPYTPLDATSEQIRLLHIVPNQNNFTDIRCKTVHVSLNTPQAIKVVACAHEPKSKRKQIWLNGHAFKVRAIEQASLRTVRESSSQSRPLLTKIVELYDTDEEEDPDEHTNLYDSIVSAAASETLYVGDAPENEAWALEIIRLTEQLLEVHSDDASNDLSCLLRSRPSANPFVCLDSLFHRGLWRTLVDFKAGMFANKKLTFRYGANILPFARLESFVGKATHAFQLIKSAFNDVSLDSAVLEESTQWENVLGLFRMRAQMNDTYLVNPVKATIVIQTLYATRYRESLIQDRFKTLRSLMPYELYTKRDPKPVGRSPLRSQIQHDLAGSLCVDFCYNTLLFTRNLDPFTLYFPNTELRFLSLPSWARFCQISSSVPLKKNPQPLLIHELVERTDGPFCAGGREWQETPQITLRHGLRALHLRGFLIDTIRVTAPHAPMNPSKYAEISEHRQWHRTRRGRFHVLSSRRAQAGHFLAILIGGKTPFLLERYGGFESVTNEYRLIGEWYVNDECQHNKQDWTLTSTAMSTV